MQEKVAHIFPAFVLKYTGKEISILERNGIDMQKQLDASSDILGIDIKTFNINENDFISDEFKNQILSYIFSCSFSDILNSKGARPDIISGFSMGLYGALYHAKAISFETGLHLLKDVFNQVENILKGKHYVMAAVIGFELLDLKQYISDYPSVEIVIQNGIYSFVISGEEEEVKTLLSFLEAEGAIHAGLFNVKLPYHSKTLTNHAAEFDVITNKYSFNSCDTPIFSMVSCKTITEAKELKEEVCLNVIKPLNFFKTIQTLDEQGYSEFIEVGADTSLLKSSKFIEGEFSFKAIARGKVI